ncbi:MAG: PIN domain-containing protein [Candidatus Aenigmarchaeota archaeon]|nr:PIN domain-containing protein [Candidatus Aenigmarchaeota archaeon]
MTENEIFAVDSNILIYNYDASDLRKHAISKDLLDLCWNRHAALAVSSQNLSEFFYVTTRRNLLGKREAAENIRDIVNFSGWMKIDFNHHTVLEAALLSEEYKMSYGDSLLAATVRENGIVNLYTENEKDFKIPWLRLVNPFTKSR